jgi:hypothetical protein
MSSSARAASKKRPFVASTRNEKEIIEEPIEEGEEEEHHVLHQWTIDAVTWRFCHSLPIPHHQDHDQQDQDDQDQHQQHHHLSMGDLVVVQDDAHPSLTQHFSRMIAPNTLTFPWRVGCILGFLTSSSTSSNAASNASTTPQVILSWLFPYSYLHEHDTKTTSSSFSSSSGPFLTRASYTALRQHVRPDGMLLRAPRLAPEHTNHRSSLLLPARRLLSDIVPTVTIALVHHTQYDPHRSPRQYHFHCHYALPATPGAAPIRVPDADMLRDGWQSLRALLASSQHPDWTFLRPCGQILAADPKVMSMPPREQRRVRRTDAASERMVSSSYSERMVSRTKNDATGVERRFYLSIPVPVVPRRCDPRATAKKSTAPPWTLTLGAVVAVADPAAAPRHRRRWYPFVGPWRVGQVLNIYRDVTLPPPHKNAFSDTAAARLEVRWFLRPMELPEGVRQVLPPPLAGAADEELYESDIVTTNVPVEHVLGPVALYLGHHTQVAHAPSAAVPVRDDVPQATARCRYYYLSTREQLQPLFGGSESLPRRWFRRLVERGFQVSPLTQSDDQLRQGIELGLDLQLGASSFPGGDGGLFSDWMRPLLEEEELDLVQRCDSVFRNPPLAGPPSPPRQYLLATQLLPSWSKMAQADFVCPASDRKGLRWTLRVGDVVAMEAAAVTTGPEETECFPYTVRWRAAQVLALYRNSDADQHLLLELQVRWFHRRPDPTTGSWNRLLASNDLHTCRIHEVLGPVTLFPDRDQAMDGWLSVEEAWKTVVPFLPMTPCRYGGHSDRTVTASWRSLVPAGIALSSHYTLEGRRLLYQALQVDETPEEAVGRRRDLPIPQFLTENVDPNVTRMENISTATSDQDKAPAKPTPQRKRGQGFTVTRTTGPPFYTDHSSGVEFFSELQVEPPLDNFATIVSDTDTPADVWTVQLGDPVIVHHASCAGRASYHYSADAKIKVVSTVHSYYPFTVPWAVGEVVAILKRPTKVSEHNSGSVSGNEADGLTIELRWFYRAKEISSKKIQDSAESDGDTEEIFESDHYDEIVPANLLAPASLRSCQRPITIGNRFNEMPLVEFHCQRFWSVHRRSLKPIGGLEGRIERGRLHSKSFGKNESLNAALLAASIAPVVSPSPTPSVTISFRDAFTRVIQKLSLTDASREAHQNASVLVGREMERQQIAAFLRAAIAGNAQANGSRGSLFIAGPPGTGKTAVSFRFVLRNSTSRCSHRSYFDDIWYSAFALLLPNCNVSSLRVDYQVSTTFP